MSTRVETCSITKYYDASCSFVETRETNTILVSRVGRQLIEGKKTTTRSRRGRPAVVGGRPFLRSGPRLRRLGHGVADGRRPVAAAPPRRRPTAAQVGPTLLAAAAHFETGAATGGRLTAPHTSTLSRPTSGRPVRPLASIGLVFLPARIEPPF